MGGRKITRGSRLTSVSTSSPIERRRPDTASRRRRRCRIGTILRLPQTWGYILSKSFTDPVWFFITDWFAIYLVAKGFKLEESLMGFWVPFSRPTWGTSSAAACRVTSSRAGGAWVRRARPSR